MTRRELFGLLATSPVAVIAARKLSAKEICRSTPGRPSVAHLPLDRLIGDETYPLVLGLSTNTPIPEDAVFADIESPIGIGYGPRLLALSDWRIQGTTARYPVEVFHVGSGGWDKPVQGYFVAASPLRGTPELLWWHPVGPFHVREWDSVCVSPSLTIE